MTCGTWCSAWYNKYSEIELSPSASYRGRNWSSEKAELVSLKWLRCRKKAANDSISITGKRCFPTKGSQKTRSLTSHPGKRGDLITSEGLSPTQARKEPGWLTWASEKFEQKRSAWEFIPRTRLSRPSPSHPFTCEIPTIPLS